MNDEVKLILLKLKIVSEEQERGLYLCDKEHSKLLLDYITNLQETKDNMEQELQELYLIKDNLQEENEMYKKELEKADSITQSCIFEGIRSAGKSYRQCLNWLEDYKSRNEKAIEYIEERKKLNWYADGVFAYELLDILQGSDKELKEGK